MIINVLIVDDEPLAHKILEGYCKKIEYLHVTGNCYDGVSAINFLDKNKVDVILLDIQMPDLNGMELVDSLSQKGPKVIFTTAYTEYAFESFNFEQVVDYLNKPIRFVRFIKAIERLKTQLVLESQSISLQTKKNATEIASKNNFITVTENKIIYKIKLIDISHIQSWGNYIKIFVDNDKMRVVRDTIKNIETELPERNFLRIHKSYIINCDRVSSIKGNLIMLNDIILPIGKSYSIAAKKRITGL